MRRACRRDEGRGGPVRAETRARTQEIDDVKGLSLPPRQQSSHDKGTAVPKDTRVVAAAQSLVAEARAGGLRAGQAGVCMQSCLGRAFRPLGRVCEKTCCSS